MFRTFLGVTQPIPADNPPEDNPRYDVSIPSFAGDSADKQWCRDIRFLKLASSLIVSLPYPALG